MTGQSHAIVAVPRAGPSRAPQAPPTRPPQTPRPRATTLANAAPNPADLWVAWGSIALASLPPFALGAPLRATAVAALAASCGVMAGRTWAWRWAWVASLFTAVCMSAPATLGVSGSPLGVLGLFGLAEALVVAAILAPRLRAVAAVVLGAVGLAADQPSHALAFALAGLVAAAAALVVQELGVRLPPTQERLRAVVRGALLLPPAALALALFIGHVPAGLSGFRFGIAVGGLAALAAAQMVALAAATRVATDEPSAASGLAFGFGLLAVAAIAVPGLPFAACAAAAATGMGLALPLLAGWVRAPRGVAVAVGAVGSACAGWALWPFLQG